MGRLEVAVFSRTESVAGDVPIRAAVSTRILALAVLAAALVLGAFLRFSQLGIGELSADEAASWAGASAPGVSAVIAAEHRLDPGKLPLYDLALHAWIAVFGDGIGAMRSMSAGIGTLAIVLLFLAVREACRSFGGAPGKEIADMAGAFAALAYAVNFMMVTSDRTVRMYPLAISAELLQIFFFVRSQRGGGWLDYGGAAIFTAAMIAANFTASFLWMAEGIWLGCLLFAKGAGAKLEGLAILRPAGALAGGIVLLGPMLPSMLRSSRQAVAMGALDWIKMQPIAWPYGVMLHAAGGRLLFWSFAALSAFAIWCTWRNSRLATFFFSLWAAGPLLCLVAVTYLIRPLEYPRYALISFVGMFALAAWGAALLRASYLNVALALALIVLSLPRTRHIVENPREAAWREAAIFAMQQRGASGGVAVFPGYCDNVVRYYVSRERREAVQGESVCGSPNILIMSGRQIMRPDQIAAMEKCYPRLLKNLSLVEVRTR
jgi:mannosyltransferase